MEEAQVSQPLYPAQPAQPQQPAQTLQQQTIDAMRNPAIFVAPMRQEDNNSQLDQNVAYQTIIDQQQAQIDALMAQTERLNGQITQMVQNGVQFAQAQQPQHVAQVQPMVQNTQYQAPMQQLNTPALSDDNDYTLDSLAKEIGKPRESV